MRSALRHFYFILGWFFFCVGLLGAFLPVLPTTPFMLLALWMLAKSSPRFHHWLYHHHLFGPPLQQWERHGVIPMRAKVAAIVMMSLSFAYMAAFAQMAWWLLLLVGLFMSFGAWFICSRPSHTEP